LVKSLTLIPAADVNGNIYPILGVGWTLFFEMSFYVFFGCVLIGRLSMIVPKLFALFGMVFLLVILMDRPVPLFLQVLAHPLVFEFLLGTLIGRFCLSDSRAKVAAGPTIGLFLLGVFLWVATIFLPVLDMLPVTLGADSHLAWTRAAFYGIPCALAVASLTLFEQDYGLKLPKLFTLVGDSSYSLYLSHLLVILAAKNVIKLFGKLHMPSIVSVFIVVCCCVFFGVFIYKYLEVPLSRALRRYVDIKFFPAYSAGRN
jgi:exopolysaccharide production protein ExoZ